MRGYIQGYSTYEYQMERDNARHAGKQWKKREDEAKLYRKMLHDLANDLAAEAYLYGTVFAKRHLAKMLTTMDGHFRNSIKRKWGDKLPELFRVTEKA